MKELQGVWTTLLPVIAMLGIGMLSRRIRLFSAADIAAFKRLIVNIALPAVLFSAFATASYTAQSALVPVVIFAACIAGYLLGKLCMRFLPASSRFLPFLCTGYEMGMLGYALYALLMGKAQVGTIAVIDIGQVFFVFTLYKALLARMEGKSERPAALVKSLFLSPTVLAILLGVCCGATGLLDVLSGVGVAPALMAVLDFVAAPTGAIILLTIGFDLDFSQIEWKTTLRTVLVRFGISVLLIACVYWPLQALMGGGKALFAAVALMFTLPPPYVLPVMATDDGERAYLSAVLSVYTLLSIAVFAVLALLVQ